MYEKKHIGLSKKGYLSGNRCEKNKYGHQI